MAKKVKVSLADLGRLLSPEPAVVTEPPPAVAPSFSIVLFRSRSDRQEGLFDPDIGPYSSFPESLRIFVRPNEDVTLEKIQKALPPKGYVFGEGYKNITTVQPIASGFEILGTQEVSRGCYIEGRWKRLKEEMIEVAVSLELIPQGDAREVGKINNKDYTAKSSNIGGGMGHDDGFMHQG